MGLFTRIGRSIDNAIRGAGHVGTAVVAPHTPPVLYDELDAAQGRTGKLQEPLGFFESLLLPYVHPDVREEYFNNRSREISVDRLQM